MGVNGKKIKVLVVDDSAVMRKLVSNLLERDAEIEVVATAIDGTFAINKVDQLRPDVVTMDVNMPRMDGLTALQQIVSRYAIPVVMLSSLTTTGARLTLQSLEMGAFDFVCKPKGSSQMGEVADELIEKVKAAARSRDMRDVTGPLILPPALRSTGPLRDPTSRGPIKLVAIGASSGGPHALRQMLPRIPADFPAGIVIVQHMPESFTALFAKWLDEICAIKVREARDGSLATAGSALIAPGNAHLTVRKRPTGAEAVLERSSPVNGHMPSVDVLFRSVASEYGDQAAALIMTGMGGDGAEGIGEVKRAGGHTIAQDKDSCTIFGMPRVAINKGYIEQVLPLGELAQYLISNVGALANRR
jgi:two-component system chemotaxis response regulator CheB